MLFKQVMYHRIVQMYIGRVLITSGNTVSGYDSPVHDLCGA